jgi:hypothetical protein
MVPLPSALWLGRTGRPLPVTALPGLCPEAIQGLETSYPGTITPELRKLLASSCGLTGTVLGDIDFTSRWFPEEPLWIFRPGLTLAIDDEGRRWIAETAGDVGLPGPVWCIFQKPEVALHVGDDLGTFLSTLCEHERCNGTREWLQGLCAEARVVWARRHALAFRSQKTCRWDRQLQGWLAGLPFDAYVYDLRLPMPARGWPYGLAGPTGRLYRCGRLSVFAVAGRPSSGRWAQHLSDIATTFPPARPAMEFRRCA